MYENFGLLIARQWKAAADGVTIGPMVRRRAREQALRLMEDATAKGGRTRANATPFGGIKESGSGREGSNLGIFDYLVPQYIRHRPAHGGTHG